MNISKLKNNGPIGSGYFCDVKKYTDEASGILYAVKQLKKRFHKNEEYRYRFLREIELLKLLQESENVIELISADKDNLLYIMPLATSNLYNHIKKKNNTLELEIRYNIVSQIISAIEIAHSKNILHRDISPNNILLFESNGQLLIKVSDFGLGKNKESLSHYTKSSVSGYGQILYVAPEQREKLNSATVKSDIYSLGKLVYFVFTGKDPDNQKPFELSSLVIKSTQENPELRFSSINEFKEHFKSLRDLMLNQKIPNELRYS
jgi:serine/threonine protein kinase